MNAAIVTSSVNMYNFKYLTSNFVNVQELKQHPAFMTEYDPSAPMSPEMEGLIALKYEGGDTTGK